jgi:hypothetical protein
MSKILTIFSVQSHMTTASFRTLTPIFSTMFSELLDLHLEHVHHFSHEQAGLDVLDQ